MPETIRATFKSDPSYLRAALLLSRIREQSGIRSVMMSSASSGEGVTTTTWHLAEALQSQHGLRPVVVELNTKRTALADWLKLDTTRTLQAVISGSMSLEDAVQIGPGDVPVLASAKSPSPMIAPSVMAEIVSRLETQYDLVLVDGPAILEDAEGLAIATVLPRIILVVKSGLIRHEVLDRLRRELENHNIQILGMILNNQKRVIPGWIYRLLAR